MPDFKNKQSVFYGLFIFCTWDRCIFADLTPRRIDATPREPNGDALRKIFNFRKKYLGITVYPYLIICIFYTNLRKTRLKSHTLFNMLQKREIPNDITGRKSQSNAKLIEKYTLKRSCQSKINIIKKYANNF